MKSSAKNIILSEFEPLINVQNIEFYKRSQVRNFFHTLVEPFLIANRLPLISFEDWFASLDPEIKGVVTNKRVHAYLKNLGLIQDKNGVIEIMGHGIITKKSSTDQIKC